MTVVSLVLCVSLKTETEMDKLTRHTQQDYTKKHKLYCLYLNMSSVEETMRSLM